MQKILNTIGKLYFAILKKKKFTDCENKNPTYTPKCKSRMKIGINQKKVKKDYCKKERHTQIDKLLPKKAKTFNYHIVLDIL